MKKFILGSIIWLTGTGGWIMAGTLDILGVSKQVDTLMYRSVGPGVMYTSMHMPDYPINVYMLTIDLKNPYNSIETFQAGNTVGKTEAMTHGYTRLSEPGHEALGSVNANFWIVSSQGYPNELLGVPHSGSARNGEVVTDLNDWNRGRGNTPEEMLEDIGTAVIDENKKAWIDDMMFDGKVKIGEDEFPVSSVNRLRENGELVFFNSYVGSVTKTDDEGTEVFIKPVAGTTWGINRDVTCEVVRICRDKGGNSIEEGESVLSGSGAAKTFLEKLSVGQRITVNMGVYIQADRQRPFVRQMVTGNALVMKNGELTQRNYNEEYNSQVYPRTAIGVSQDGDKVYLVVVDGKTAGNSVGASTETICGILKASGASNVTSMDGGGSAQMMLKGEIVNHPADGKERAVANGWMVFNTAPEETTVDRIEFADYKVVIPAYAAYKPQILAYNRYGVLVEENQQGVELKCTSGLGTVDADGRFIASGTPGTGLLTARYRGIEVTKNVEVVSGEIAFRLDSVIMDDYVPYPVEVESKSGSQTMLIAPEALSWWIEDPSICRIEKGVLSGLQNGVTRIAGELNGIRDTMKVYVQIPESAVHLQEDFSEFASFKISPTPASAFKNVDMATSLVPEGWDHGVGIRFIWNGGRNPLIKLEKDIYMFGLPDTVRVVLNSGDVKLSKAIVSLKGNNDQFYNSFTFNSNLVPNEDITLSVPVDRIITAPSDKISYPIRLNYLSLYLQSTEQTVGQEYTIALKEISLVYDRLILGIERPGLMSRLCVYPNPLNPGQPYVYLKCGDEEVSRIEVYNLAGQSMQIRPVNLQGNEIMLPVNGLSAGTYIVKVYMQQRTEQVKVLIR